MGVLEAAPRKVVLGDVTLGTATDGEIVIKNTGDADMKITKVVSKKFKHVYFDGEVTIAPEGSHSFPIQVSAEKTGRYLDFVMIHSNARNVTKKGYKVIVTAAVKE